MIRQTAATPLVSVIIPTRNRPVWLKTAAESVLAQTITDLEILIVLNGASSEAVGMARSLLADQRVKIIEMDFATVPGARNRGVAAARGEWVAFLDDDDVWLPQKLELQLAAAEAKGAEIVTCNFMHFDETGDIPESGLTPRPAGLSFAEALMLANYVSGGSALIVKASIVRSVGGWDERISCCDWDLWRRMSFDHEIHFVDQVLVKYRRHHSNRSDDRDLMLPGIIIHFGKMMQDTPTHMRHMLPRAKLQFLEDLIWQFSAAGVTLDSGAFPQWSALEARCLALEAELRNVLATQNAILSSRSWLVTKPLRGLRRGVTRMVARLR